MRSRNYFLFNCLLIIVFLSFFSSLAFATADGPDYLGVRDVVPNHELAIHLSPTDSSELVGKIPHNATCLKNLGCTGGSNWWCKIDYQGAIGWVNGQFLQETGDCSSSTGLDAPERSITSSSAVFTKQLLDGKVIYTHDQQMDSFIKLEFQESNLASFDGSILFAFLKTKDCLPGNVEQLHYRLKQGKIIYYANDGSKKRLTLQAITSTSWAVQEEEDIDGDDSRLDYGQAVNNIYKFENSCEDALPD